MTKNREEKLYNSLKTKVLETNSISSSFIDKAKQLKEQDTSFANKVEKIGDYLIDKMKHGDSLAYSIYYAVHEAEIALIQNTIYENQGEKMLSFISTAQISIDDMSSDFFDYKVVYIATELELIGAFNAGTEEL